MQNDLHTSKQYDAELDQVRSQVLRMGALVERQVVYAVEALRRTDAALHERVIESESEINSLEHHGLNRCLDVGIGVYLRYAGLGVLSYNLHVIGRDLLARERAKVGPSRAAA